MALAQPPGWYVISLRPVGHHGALRAAAARCGAGLLALSPWRLQQCSDTASRTSLQLALEASRVVFTSPAAVRAAAALQTLHPVHSQSWIAVGSATAAALKRAGVAHVQSPQRMDSEGLLDLAALQEVNGVDIGLVTAPQGRDLLASALVQRGARLLRADVYQRLPMPLSPRVLEKLRALDHPACIALSSGAALGQTLASLPQDLLPAFKALPVAVTSERLLRLAGETGFQQVALAKGPRPAQLLAAIAHRFR